MTDQQPTGTSTPADAPAADSPVAPVPPPAAAESTAAPAVPAPEPVPAEVVASVPADLPAAAPAGSVADAAPAAVAVVQPAVAEPPAVAPVPPPPVRRKRDRALGTTGQVVGVLGILVCLVLIVGTIFARGYAVSTVDDVAANIDAQIAKVSPILTQAHTTVGEVSGKVSTVADIAAGIAADPSPGGGIAQTLRDAIGSVNERYQGLRQGYAGIRETVLSLVDKLQTLDRLIPGLSIPQGPIDALNNFDSRLQEFDTKVNDLLTIEPGNGPVNQAAAKISDAANGLDTKLQAVQDGITQVDDRVTQLRTDIANTASTVNTIITLVTIFIVLLLLYLMLLHWVLFRHSGEIRRKTVTP